jgi:hypothetical protein
VSSAPVCHRKRAPAPEGGEAELEVCKGQVRLDGSQNLSLSS